MRLRPSLCLQRARILLTNSSSSSLDNQRVTNEVADDSIYISVRTGGFAFFECFPSLSSATPSFRYPPCRRVPAHRAARRLVSTSASSSPFLNDDSPRSPEPHASLTVTTTRGTPRTLPEPPRTPSTTTAMGMHPPTPSRARPKPQRR